MSQRSRPKTLGKMQGEHRDWQKRNFPDTGVLELTLGVGEELGELAEAGQNGGYGCAEGIDAMADMVIYLMGVSNAVGFDLWEAAKANEPDWSVALDYLWNGRGLNILPEHDAGQQFQNLVSLVGQLQHGVLKASQQIRNHEDHLATIQGAAGGVVMQLMMLYATVNDSVMQEVMGRADMRSGGLTFGESLDAIWSKKVSKRDWIANPDTAHEETTT